MIATTAVFDDGRIYKRARINIGFMKRTGSRLS